jgi:hypothetical protein
MATREVSSRSGAHRAGFVKTPLFSVQTHGGTISALVLLQGTPTAPLRFARTASASGAVFGSALSEIVVRRELESDGHGTGDVRVGDPV